MDYLITTKQLILINSKKDIEYFHRKSKIEAIVEGRPAKNITQDHFDAIIHKLRIFKMIVWFIFVYIYHSNQIIYHSSFILARGA